MADVILFVALLAAVPCVYLIGFVAGKQACEQTRRDERSVRSFATARENWPRVWPPHHSTENERDESYAQAELRAERG